MSYFAQVAGFLVSSCILFAQAGHHNPLGGGLEIGALYGGGGVPGSVPIVG